jgi:methyltransferase (TIGR00027 family)
MIPGQPSRTAFAAAAHRAAHQVLEGGRIFADPFAVRILGEPAEAIAAEIARHPERQAMRFFIACRARVAEDAVAAAVARGVRQVVILGAGLDTFAYRQPHGDRVLVFEVDYPATGAWKQARLAEAGIPIPGNVVYAGIDFERDSLVERLEASGFDAAAPSFFVWLGVVPYLTEAAIFATLGAIAALPGGTEVVFDYGDPIDTLPPGVRAALTARAAQVAALGEAWLSQFEPAVLHARLVAAGFTVVADLGPVGLVARFNPGQPGPAQDRGGHVLHARVGGLR